MVLIEENFGETDLETLANMGITADRSGRLRIGHAVAKEMGLGGGRWLKREEDAKVPAAVKGYNNPDLPESIKTSGTYSTLEIFHLAAEAANGVPDLSSPYAELHQSLEEQLGISRKGIASDGADGLPTRSILADYWQHNQRQVSKGYSPDTPQQFIDGLVDSVERTLVQAENTARKFVDIVKGNVMTEPAQALQSAVEATYLQALVTALRPQVEKLKGKSYAPAADAQPITET